MAVNIARGSSICNFHRLSQEARDFIWDYVRWPAKPTGTVLSRVTLGKHPDTGDRHLTDVEDERPAELLASYDVQYADYRSHHALLLTSKTIHYEAQKRVFETTTLLLDYDLDLRCCCRRIRLTKVRVSQHPIDLQRVCQHARSWAFSRVIVHPEPTVHDPVELICQVAIKPLSISQGKTTTKRRRKVSGIATARLDFLQSRY